MRGRVVNTSNSGSGGPGFKPRPSRCTFRQGTLLHLVSLHEYRRQTAGGTSAMDQEGKAILLGMLSCIATGVFRDKLRPFGPLVCVRLYHYLLSVWNKSFDVTNQITLFTNTFTWYYLSILCVLYDRPSRRNLGNRFFMVYSSFSLLRLFFSKGKEIFFSGGNFCFIKGMSMLFSQSKQTNQQK